MSQTEQTHKHDLFYKVIITLVILMIGILIGYAIGKA